MYKILSILVLVIFSSACGFHLKGTQHQPSLTAPSYQQLGLEIAPEHQILAQPLSTELKASGIQLHPQAGQVLRILDYQFRRQQLKGKLTEVLLHTQVTFRIEDAQGKALSQERTVRSHRNYQYNIETVNTENQQESYLKQKMLEEVAQQISLQLTNQRLPSRQ